MAKIKLSDKNLTVAVSKLTPSWTNCFDQKTIEDAQIAPSQTRNFMFGTIINHKYIKLTKATGTFKAGDVVSIADIYTEKSAQSIAGLIIYRLGHPSGLINQPTLVEA